jgi:hypothetical protein
MPFVHGGFLPSSLLQSATAAALAMSTALAARPASAATSISGQVLGAGAPIANSTVTLWAASSGNPAQPPIR